MAASRAVFIEVKVRVFKGFFLYNTNNTNKTHNIEDIHDAREFFAVVRLREVSLKPLCPSKTAV